jgi:hypothetical protein
LSVREHTFDLEQAGFQAYYLIRRLLSAVPQLPQIADLFCLG